MSFTKVILLNFVAIGVVSALALGQKSTQGFWDSEVRGANCFNQKVTSEWCEAARSTGLDFIRLMPNKWTTKHRDFLLGNADNYNGLVQEDLDELIRVLDLAHDHGLKVVLSTVTLPGARWRQQNSGKWDTRLWTNKEYWGQAKEFWRDLAGQLKGHPALIGYNILNEPIPEMATGYSASEETIDEWYRRVQGTSADLNDFNCLLIETIRAVDSAIPILIDAGSWAAPEAFKYLRPVSDSLVLYSFHMYEPWEYTNRKANGGKVQYPDSLAAFTCSDNGRHADGLNRRLLECLIEPVVQWQSMHSVPANRIIAAEFGCHRMSPGAADYLKDLMDIFNQNRWHWAFYSFREDTWDGMDYEIGNRPLGWEYWKAKDRGENPEPARGDNLIWRVILQHLKDRNEIVH